MLTMTLQHDASRAAPEADPAAQMPRALEKGWHERHVRWQAEGRIPPGRTQLRYEDGSLAFDRRGYPRMWSEAVAAATRKGLRSQRTIAREQARREEASRQVEAVRAMRAQVQPGLRAAPGRLFTADLASLTLRGPAGGIGASERLMRTLVPLSESGRRPAAALQAAGSWADETSMFEALAALSGKLAAIGLRIDKRKAGIRMGRLRPEG